MVAGFSSLSHTLAVGSLLLAADVLARSDAAWNWMSEHGDLNRRQIFFDPTCNAIKAVISNSSGIYAPGSSQYEAQVNHWSASSTIRSKCSVEPGTPEDLAAILKVLATSNSTFAVRGAGHSCAPGFSGAKGVNIAMTRFNEVSYDKSQGIVKYGSGLVWDDVYTGLEKYDVKVTGGRVSGVGVAGFSLGGGFSFLTSQYGTTSDGIVAYDFVTATGKILYVTRKTYPDLFFLLQGGFNNAGVVTNFYAKARPRARVYGGIISLDGTQLDAVINITARYAAKENLDLEGSILPTLNSVAGSTLINVQMFYDHPAGPPDGSYTKQIFDDLLSLKTTARNVSTDRTMTSLASAAPAHGFKGFRGTFSTVSLERLTPEILQTIKNELKHYGPAAPFGGGFLISYALEPFALAKSYPAASSTAWPHDKLISPLNLDFAWPTGLSDGIFYDAIRKSTKAIQDAAIAQGQDLSGRYQYPNYALYDTPFEEIYGPNLPRLIKIAAKYDPGKVMTRAGGFQFQNPAGKNTYGIYGP
ncbi:hypothetical protein V8E36_008950 [Tilletia maclaganii]